MIKIYVRGSRIIGITPDLNPYFSIIFRINLQALIKKKSKFYFFIFEEQKYYILK